MAKYKYLLTNGKHLVIESDQEPDDATIEAEAKKHGVQLAVDGGASDVKPMSNVASAPAANTPEPSMLQTLADNAQQGIQNFAKGAGKGALDMAVGAGEMVHKIPGVSALTDKLYGMPSGSSKAAFDQAHNELAPKTFAERLGRVGTDIGAMVLAPEVGSLPKLGAATKLPRLVEAAGIPGILAGAQTGGDPEAMAGAAAMGAGGELASDALKLGAGKIRAGQADKVATQRTAKMAKQAGDSMDDPFWMQARNTNAGKYADMVKQYGITGAESDIAKIKAAPPRDQEVLSALSNMMNKKGSLGHEWSLWSTLAGLAGFGAGGGPGVGVVAPAILASAMAKKYPGQVARGLESLGSLAPKAGQVFSGIPGGIHVDPMTQALFDQENK